MRARWIRFLACLFALLPQAAAAEGGRLDLVVENGRVVDGTGAPWFRADVGILDDRIVAVGDLSRRLSRRRIDAKGMIVAPGFIDLLGHSEFLLLADNRAESKIRQGITTEFHGEGITAAPLNAAIVEENKGALKRFGIEADWTDLAGYRRRLAASHPALNVGSFVSASQVRAFVMGFRSGPPTAGELARMEQEVERAMRQGAVGLSTALAYPPGSYAATDEIIALARVASRLGGIYATHLRDEGAGIDAALDEAFRVGREARIPVEIWHVKLAGRDTWGRMAAVLGRIEAERRSGLDVSATVYPYEAALNGLLASVPRWAREGGTGAFLERVRDPELRGRLAREIREGIPGDVPGFAKEPPSDLMLRDTPVPAHQQYLGLRLVEVARRMGLPPEAAYLELLEASRGDVAVVRFWMSAADVDLAVRRPWVGFVTDASATATDGRLAARGTHPRAYGGFPRVLSEWVREREAFPLEEAIRRMTSLPASRTRLLRRGLLRPGMAADVVVLDPATIRDLGSYEQPDRYATGVRHVIVNGRIVLDDGRMTGERPGRYVSPGTEERIP